MGEAANWARQGTRAEGLAMIDPVTLTALTNSIQGDLHDHDHFRTPSHPDCRAICCLRVQVRRVSAGGGGRGRDSLAARGTVHAAMHA